MSFVQRVFRNRPAFLTVIAAVVLLIGGATFTASKVAASGNDDGECAAGVQSLEDGSNDGEAKDDQSCTDVEGDDANDAETNDD